MSLRRVFFNKTLSDKRLPFTIEVSPSLTVYYRKPGEGNLRRADSLFLKKTEKLNVSIDEYNIMIHGLNDKGDFVYTIKKDGVEIQEIENKAE